MRELIGLSPLARGTRLRGSDTRRKAPVYPRWRGEHAVLLASAGGGDRFIPAGAGNTKHFQQ